MKKEALQYFILYFWVSFPFLIMAIKGRKYALKQAGPVKLFFGGLLWFTLSSWTVLGAGGHGIIFIPMPNLIAVPVWFLYSDLKDVFNFPYTVYFKHAYWVFPLLQVSTFYLAYILFRPSESK